ncbi:LysE family transporter [Actinoplanes oblitus]|uniref:LysE family transporter n=1 Tax=Actinoplanes oblitus TaxID=3040509 RepID=A0ABY8WPQ1_9ACTN|nr:LysE family transporter [Actinoplanes oblitus]WIM99835.1 LysE family transporter [Actinoplanes oblitus]
MTQILLAALGIGLVFNLVPGPVFAESLRRGVRGGFRPALAVQIGSLVGDAVWAILGLSGVAALFLLPAVRTPLTVVGCLILAWLGAAGIRNALAVPDTRPAGPGNAGRSSAMLTGAGMSLGNPWNIVYWAGSAGAVAGTLGQEPELRQLAAFLGGFMGASLLWCLVCAGLIAGLRRALRPAAVRGIEAVTGVALLAFAVLLLIRLVQS